MKAYIHYRGTEDWQGAVIIAADSYEESIKMFVEREDERPSKSEEMEDVEVSGVPRILYDDYSR